MISSDFTIESGSRNLYNIFDGGRKTQEELHGNKGWLDNSLSFVTRAKGKGQT